MASLRYACTEKWCGTHCSYGGKRRTRTHLRTSRVHVRVQSCWQNMCTRCPQMCAGTAFAAISAIIRHGYFPTNPETTNVYSVLGVKTSIHTHPFHHDSIHCSRRPKANLQSEPDITITLIDGVSKQNGIPSIFPNECGSSPISACGGKGSDCDGITDDVDQIQHSQ